MLLQSKELCAANPAVVVADARCPAGGTDCYGTVAIAPTQEDVERCACLFVLPGFNRVFKVLPCIQSSRLSTLLYQNLSH